MKKTYISCTLLMVAMIAIGCSSTNDADNGALPNAPYLILPNDLSFTGWVEIEKNSQILNPSKDDYVNFDNLVVIFSIFSYDTGASFEWCERNNEYLSTVKEEVKRINNGSEYLAPRDCPNYVYGTASNIEVYADTKLWGLEPGEDLSDHFKLHQNNYPFIPYNPATPLTESDTEQMSSCDLKMLSSVLLPCGILIHPKSIPEEQPQEITFTISITISPNHTYKITVNRVKLSYQN